MPKRIPEQELQAIQATVQDSTTGATTQQIAQAMGDALPLRTLQYRLRHLVATGQLQREGEGRWVKYHPSAAQVRAPQASDAADCEATLPLQTPSDLDPHRLSARSAELRRFLLQRPAARRPAGGRRRLLDSYRPNVTAYLRRNERARLAELGALGEARQSPGAGWRQLQPRVEMDLAWRSARLSGNGYTELEVRRLIKFHKPAEARGRRETQAVLNHQQALAFLLDYPADIGFNRFTIQNLHAVLAHNLLADESCAGRLRSVDGRFRPGDPASKASAPTIEATFRRFLETAAAIADPFEQAFFALVQLPYLAPFPELNARVSRLAANIPLVRHNLAPLSFVDVPDALYRDAIRGVVERSRIDLLKDFFLWAYEQSAGRYAAGGQGPGPGEGQPDPFRLEYDGALQCVVSEVIRQGLGRQGAARHIAAWSEARIAPVARERFRDLTEHELAALHEGNFARYPIAPTEFRAWQTVWASANGAG
jgi:hypothetical protein